MLVIDIYQLALVTTSENAVDTSTFFFFESIRL